MASKKVSKVKRTKERCLLGTMDRLSNPYSYSGRVTKVCNKNGTTMALIEELRDSSDNEFLSPHIWVEVTEEIRDTIINSARNKAHMTFLKMKMDTSVINQSKKIILSMCWETSLGKML